MLIPLLRLAVLLGVLLLALLLFFTIRFLNRRRRRRRQRRDDGLKLLYKRELAGNPCAPGDLAAALALRPADGAALEEGLRAAGLLARDADRLRLTPAGANAARHLVRAHRLWERYLADHTGYNAGDWHLQAEEEEHALSAVALAALEAQLGYPTHDPHGDPIPHADGTVVHHTGRPLPDAAPGRPLRIVHLEDEPPDYYAQLLAAGLATGQSVQLLSIDDGHCRLRHNGTGATLPLAVAANISVVAEREPADAPLPAGRLTQLNLGETAAIAGIARTCRRTERRRLLDLGLVPGTAVTAVLRSPSGDPVAYEVRGALIALRREQTDQIAIQETPA